MGQRTTNKKVCRRKKASKDAKMPTGTTTNTVVNISNVPLLSAEWDLLSSGLSFCPKPSQIDQFQLEEDIQQFFRRLHLKEFFHDVEGDENDNHPFKKKSKWAPPCNKDPALETYVKAVRDDIHWALNSGSVHQTRHNLTSTERKALLLLRSRSNTVIKPADKGSATVVMSRQDYLDKVISHLQNEEYYFKLDEEPTSRYAEEITCFLTEMMDRQAIDKETFKYLRPQDPRTSQFYILPKIHKEGNPRRPIVSSCGVPMKRIYQFVDHHLHPLVVKRILSYIKDTTDFLLKLQSIRVPLRSLLLTLDVSALYTNIPHEGGIMACRKLLNTRDVLESPMEDIIKLITLILKWDFSFNNEHYIQKKERQWGHVWPPRIRIYAWMTSRDEFLPMWTERRPRSGDI